MSGINDLIERNLASRPALRKVKRKQSSGACA